jgi:hypothetical protein
MRAWASGIGFALISVTAAADRAAGQSAWPSYPDNAAITETSGGNVGIGTAVPAAKLTVGANALPASVAYTPQALVASDTQATGDAQTRMMVYQTGYNLSAVAALVSGVVGGGNPYFAIETPPGGGGNISERFRIDSYGMWASGRRPRSIAFRLTEQSEQRKWL